VKNNAIRLGILLVCLLIASPPATAGGKPAKNANAGTSVDAGTFSILRNGRRIATETFHVLQRADHSVTTSELKLEDGSAQSSELQLWTNGDLRKYMWRSISPEKAESVLEPGDQVLIQRISTGAGKPQDLPYILPPSTIVLDDYFFVHRELLAWRYLASTCASGESKCPLTKAQLGIIVPRQHTPATVTMEYLGREKVSLRGTERELSRFTLKSEDQEWQLWLDDQHKLVRIVIASENTEVLRD
jgi:hypothetical protein